MKRAELEELGIDKEAIDKIMKLNGADIEAKKTEVATLRTQLSEAQTSLKEAQKELEDAGAKDETITTLREQVKAYEDSEKQRKEAEKEEALTAQILETFPKDKEFTSDYVKKGIIKDIKEALAKDQTKGAKEIFESLTKDEKGNVIEGIFKNSQHETLDLPPDDTNGEDDKPAFKNFF